uniref:Uncharacterized protein n=1 Tax=Knipowitschia caucasica TaxID=637954 RepID=A0AAV2J9T9_KNICA
MEAKGFYHERASRVVKTLFPRNENSPQAEVKQRAAVSMSLVRDNKDRWMADIEQRLAVRTAELTAERARVATPHPPPSPPHPPSPPPPFPPRPPPIRCPSFSPR